MQSKNMILYGPPGTGKTYTSSQWAVALSEHMQVEEVAGMYSRAVLKEKFRQYQQEGRIAFVTFHQSFSYEDFVEGIKPFRNEKNELYYDVEDGVFKQICYNAAYALLSTQQKRLFRLSSQPGKRNFDSLYFEFVDYLKRMMKEGSKEVIFETKTQKALVLENINQHDTLAFRYEKGKRTYGVTKSALSQLYRQFPAIEAMQAQDVQKGGGKGSTTLYWAVLHRLKEFERTRVTTYNYILNQRQFQGQQVSEEQYQRMKRELSQFDYTRLRQEDYQAAGNFVLVIDEINRGNIAGILGELITLIEADKRAGMPEALHTILPYSRERFSIPPNLYIIGTMNTADRSIESLDTALRRRFAFQEILPDPSLLQINSPQLSVAAEPETAYQQETAAAQAPSEINLQQLLLSVNTRLEKLIDRDHTLGHAYFLPVLQAAQPWQKLREIFYQQIIPLLQEYFFTDFGKIELVIGKAFFEKQTVEAKHAREFFAESDQDVSLQEEYFQKPVYRIRQLQGKAFQQAIQQIYEHKPLS